MGVGFHPKPSAFRALGEFGGPHFATVRLMGARLPILVAPILPYTFYLMRRVYLYLIATFITLPYRQGIHLRIPHIAYIEKVPTHAMLLYITGRRRYRRGTSGLRELAYNCFLSRGGGSVFGPLY